MPLEPNQTLLHYRIVEKIGEGGMGEVYLAEDTKLGRRIALKLLPPAMANDPDRLRRFQREARAAAALTHPNIVTLHSVEEDTTSTGSVHFLTMEWVDGESLREKIPAGGMPPNQVMQFGLPVARALAAAHERGITHRDLKPDNIMVGRDGIPKVLDFGLAKIETQVGDPTSDETRSVTERITREGVVIGTVAYMAPEQVKGLPLDARSDIFSFGVVLYEMATGKQPFAAASTAETMSAILRDEPEALEYATRAAPIPFAQIVERCLRKEPTQRYASAGELTAALEAIELTAIESRSCCSMFISILKPRPSSPSRFATGTRQPSKNSSLVSWPLRPSFSRLRPRRKPSRSVSTRIRLMPSWGGLAWGSVLATTITRSAIWPLEMKVLAPSSTYSSPSRIARVWTLARSEPVPGSVIATASTQSPDMAGARKRCFCSGVPYSFR